MAAFFGANEIWKSYDGDGREPVILVGVRETDVEKPISEDEFRHSLEELAELAKACEMNPVDTVTQSLSHINTGLYVGAGKADEIRIRSVRKCSVRSGSSSTTHCLPPRFEICRKS